MKRPMRNSKISLFPSPVSSPQNGNGFALSLTQGKARVLSTTLGEFTNLRDVDALEYWLSHPQGATAMFS